MKQLLVLFMLLCSATAFAQDVIVKKDGSTILAKVLEVNTDNIKYKKHSNQNGPTYTISKSETLSINYENGEKDDFSGTNNSGDSHNSGQGLIIKSADAHNEQIIARHNVVHPNFNGKKPGSKACTYCTVKYGIKSSSILSNEDLEMEFIGKIEEDYKYGDYLNYCMKLTNKTDRVLYIDKGNCFTVYNDGYSSCFFDASKQTTVSNGRNSGGSVNLGSLAGAFGIGGVIGQIAGGVNVGGGTSSSVSTTYTPQRFEAIAPHGSIFFYVHFDLWYYAREHEFKSTVEIGLKRGVVNNNGTRVFGEDELPWKKEYFITYSTDDTFSTYSALHAELYIQEIIGDEKRWRPYSNELVKLHRKGKWFLNDNTIVGSIELDKK